MNSVRATTLSSVYLAMRHIFPDVPISAGAFEPLSVTGIEGTFLDAHYPRPVSGCAAEVSQRIAEAVFAAWCRPLPDRVTAAPAGTSGNFGLGGHDPETGPRLRDVPDLGRRLWRQCRPRRAVERLFHHRHLQGPARRDHGAELPRPLPPLCAARRARAARGSTGAGFGLDYEVELLRGAGAGQLRDGPRADAGRRARWAGRTAR